MPTKRNLDHDTCSGSFKISEEYPRPFYMGVLLGLFVRFEKEQGAQETTTATLRTTSIKNEFIVYLRISRHPDLFFDVKTITSLRGRP